MGQFTVGVTFYPPNGGASRTLKALVDTGAAYSVAPRPFLDSLGCQPLRSQRVIFADGRAAGWWLTQVDVDCEGRRTTTTVLMAPPGSPVLLGAITLEGLGLGIDPVNLRLVPVDLFVV